MAQSHIESIANVLSTGAIVAVVIGSIIGFAICIGVLVIIVCLIKQCSRPRNARTQGLVLQQPYPYSHSWTTQYPPNITSVSNYPPLYQTDPPPYTASAPPKPF